MEGLSESFAAQFTVSSEPNDTAAPHPRMAQYKTKPSNTPDQFLRRQRMLEGQKKRRRDFVNYARKLVEGSLEVDDIETEEMEFVEEHDKDHRRGYKKKFNPYAYQLMLSEWLVDVPDDLVQEWFMVVCPMGRRNLVIAANGFTAAYTKSGYRVNKFSSLLPGGSPKTLKPGDHTILDCIFNEVTNTFYVLDVMSWRGHPVYDSETDFRFYWLQTKLQEEPLVTQVSTQNPYRFVSLPHCPCDDTSIQQALSGASSASEVDGLLFFHKRTHYTCGRTPLVGWLKPHMLPEILGVSVPEAYLEKAPPVNKLTLLKSNRDLREGDEEKRNATEKCVLEEKMDTQSTQKTKGRQRRKNGRENATRMEVEEDSTDKKGFEDEAVDCSVKMEVSQNITRSRGRRKKEHHHLDTSQTNEN
ncbi:snurportin-1-like isoform X1 [Orbicella faveolata]|uniref:snurportin-1-like isoform X1 n=2 Tax=Orbicella faveolata TaxID=48498 RepID=UPI0009E41511|nr:snurportin-1-like isoform X1 [Orbicella faveolata]